LSEGKRQVQQVATISERGPTKRQHARFDVELDVHFGSEHNFYAGFVENLSVGGVFIATHDLKPLGSIVSVSIFLPGNEIPVTGKGEVRWIRELNVDSDVTPGMGIRFVELEGHGDLLVREFIKRRDPMFFDDE